MSYNLNDFVRILDLTSPTENLLAITYFYEHNKEKAWLSVAELEEGYTAARIPLPINLYDMVRKCASRGLLISNKKSKPYQYQLSQQGIDLIEKRREAIDQGEKIGEEDRLLNEISESLRESLLRIPDLDERGYIQEALACLDNRVKAYRAAVLMSWAGTIYHLRKKAEQLGFDRFSQEYATLSLGKPRDVKSIDDLEFYSDNDFLLVIERMGIVDKAVRIQLKNCLDLRNACGHPTQVMPKIHRVKAFFEDIIEYVFSR